MKLDFTGKTVVVTGATDGIGLATARLFGECGAKVAICARRKERLAEVEKQFRDLGIEVYAQSVDVQKSDEIYDFAEKTVERFGGIDVFVSNAGFMPYAPIKDMEEDFWDEIIDTNLKSIYFGGRIAYKYMRQKGGVLVNGSSFAEMVPSVGYSAYAAAKAGAKSLTKTFASELAPYGIRVVGYMPGFIDTPLNAARKAQSMEKALEPISLRRLGLAEDVANVIVFLASDYASYVTGTCIDISGGKFSTQIPEAAWDLAAEEGVVKPTGEN